jgi:hypothetical protein
MSSLYLVSASELPALSTSGTIRSMDSDVIQVAVRSFLSLCRRSPTDPDCLQGVMSMTQDPDASHTGRGNDNSPHRRDGGGP